MRSGFSESLRQCLCDGHLLARSPGAPQHGGLDCNTGARSQGCALPSSTLRSTTHSGFLLTLKIQQMWTPPPSNKVQSSAEEDLGDAWDWLWLMLFTPMRSTSRFSTQVGIKHST